MNAALEVSEGEIDPEPVLEEARSRADYSEFDFIELVSTRKPRFIQAETCREVGNLGELTGERRCVIVDCGMKRSISTRIAERKFDVVIVPHDSTTDDVMSFDPTFVMVSNGPGDPLRAVKPQRVIRELAPDLPMMNICMGHQLTALALGGKHFKLKFGHRGGNQPVKDLGRDNVYITTQNHGFAIDPDSLSNTGLKVTMTNLNDGSVEGMVHQDYRIITTQFHPEATPGPLDANFLFDEFINSL
jgi:carbamoyl-phosphate synthase small subunit